MLALYLMLVSNIKEDLVILLPKNKGSIKC